MSLNKNSKMVCKKHGIQPPAFICRHLRHGVGQGFNEPDEDLDPEYPFKEAWCDACDALLMVQGEWNDISESHAQIMAVCEGCFNEIKARNKNKIVEN